MDDIGLYDCPMPEIEKDLGIGHGEAGTLVHLAGNSAYWGRVSTLFCTFL